MSRLTILAIIGVLALCSGCKKKPRSDPPTPLSVSSKAPYRARGAAKTLGIPPLARRIPLSAPAVLQVKSLRWLIRWLHLPLGQRLTNYRTPLALKWWSLRHLEAGGIDVGRPFMLFVTGTAPEFVGAVFSLAAPRAFVTLHRIAGAAILERGKWTVINDGPLTHLVHDKVLLSLFAFSAAGVRAVTVAVPVLTALTGEQSLVGASSPFRQQVSWLAFGEHLQLSANLPRWLTAAGGIVAKHMPFLLGKHLGPITVGLSMGVRTARLRAVLGRQRTSARSVPRAPQQALGWTVIDHTPLAALRFDSDFAALVRQLSPQQLIALDRLLPSAVTARWPCRRIARLLGRRLELYLSPLADPDGNLRARGSLFVRLRDVKGTERLLDALHRAFTRTLRATQGFAMTRHRIESSTIYRLLWPTRSVMVLAGVIRGHLLLTTDRTIVERLIKATRSSYVDRIHHPQLKALARGNNTLYAELAVARTFHLLRAVKRRLGTWDPVQESYFEVLSGLGSLGINLNRVPQGIEGHLVWRLTPSTFAHLVSQTIQIAVRLKRQPTDPITPP